MSDKVLKFLGIGTIILGILTVIVLPILFINEFEDEIKNVPCYDKHGNEIEGLTCIDEPESTSEIILIIFFSFMVGGFLTMIGIMMYRLELM